MIPTAVCAARRKRSRGGTLVEFTMVVFLLVIVLLSVVEMGRMVLVYTTVTNSARAAARYAIVHGASRTGTGKDGPSGPGANPAEIVQVVKDFASTGLLDVNSLTINVTYPAGVNTVGGTVDVAVSYTYNPFIGMLPLRVPLSNASRGVIVF
jgi:Flp pilus assembly protein TadG